MRQKPASKVLVVHFGNSPDGPGGISSVVRRHLERSFSELHTAESVSTYEPASSKVRRLLVLLRAISQLRRVRRGTVVHVHMSQRGSLVREGLIIWIAASRRLPVIVTLHGSTISASSSLNVRLIKLATSPARLVHGFADGYKDLLGIESARWLTRVNDVPVPASVRDLTDRTQRVLFAGEVGRRKGSDLLLEAWQACQQSGWTLTLAGPVSAELATAIAESPPTVEVLGQVEHHRVQALLSDSQIVIQPSRAEAFPMTVCEALAAGCAVVGTQVGGMGELLERAGQLAIDGTVKGVTDGLQRVIGDTAAREAQARSGRQYALASLSSEVLDSAWEQTYEALGRERSET